MAKLSINTYNHTTGGLGSHELEVADSFNIPPADEKGWFRFIGEDAQLSIHGGNIESIQLFKDARPFPTNAVQSVKIKR